MIRHSKPSLDYGDVQAIARSVKSGQIAQGRTVENFEKEVAGYIGIKGGVAVSSGTAALHLALLSLGIKKGDEVILPSFACAALLNAVLYIGAKPVFADVELEDYNISPPDVRRRLGRRTKAIIVVHIFGQPAQVEELKGFGVPIVEDIAHSIGAEYKNKKVGSFGSVCVTSFFATKVITTGEGGMVLSKDKKILADVRDLREYDKKKNFRLRFNYKMTDAQAALGLKQLEKLPAFICRRRKIAGVYNNALKGARVSKPLAPSAYKKGIYYRYVIRTGKEAGSIVEAMRKRGISSARPIFKPLHRYFNLSGYPNTELAWRQAVSVPIYPALTNAQMGHIADALREAGAKYA